MQRLVTGSGPVRASAFDPTRYRLDAINCSTDLADLADRVQAWRATGGPGLSLCIYGPPGTGKTELVKYLAHRMGRRVVQRRASDILNKWVGETERQIAATFREAEEDGAVLLFDEVDSLLRDRLLAERSWELTRVNEFLQQLESFSGVVACTTNLWRELDPAALRRFVFKLELRPLRSVQAEALFRVYFPPTLTETSDARPSLRAELANLGSLTPGDFAAVSRRVKALGRALGPEELVRELRLEVRARNSGGASGVEEMGFRLSPRVPDSIDARKTNDE